MSNETDNASVAISSAEAALERERTKARHCTACPLYKKATQTVFGEGPAPARIMMVGEQPGDREDRTGRPFVGPAGRLLDRALEEAGIVRSEVYVTNAVKHFKWERSGKVRLHKKPGAAEIAACKPWLERELALVRPALVVALGATAAQTLMGRSFRVTVAHGKLIKVPWAKNFMATVHPSSILRAPSERREMEYKQFVADLRVAGRKLGGQR